MTIVEPYRIYIERTDKTRNMARFYAMSIEPTLFGETAVTRRWGRIGSTGREMVCHFARETDAVALFLELLQKKTSRRLQAVCLGLKRE
ncbi:WGR domain-containing protein [Shinella sp. M31]|uniref:WGR domain-containing protein n=1 Tax=Shinella sp. M31 TaxID=3368615 RepID=UPI003B9F90AA